MNALPESHTVELLVGIGVGIALSFLSVCFWGGCCRERKWGALSDAGSSGVASIAKGFVDIPHVYYNGAFFCQFSWCLDASALEKETGALRVLDADGRQVVRAIGRLMATPNGEVQLQNSMCVPWAVLKRAVPNKRQGQLWDFRVCGSDGAVRAEVKQRSETKAVVVEPAPSQRRLMTVIGNFGHRVFLTGERCVHVWTSLGGDRPSLGAQCEVRVEAVRCAGGPGGQNVVTPVRSFYVSATMSTDAPLVLAVLLGLQEVQTTLGCAPKGMAAVPEVAPLSSTAGPPRSKNGLGNGRSSPSHELDSAADAPTAGDVAASASTSATPAPAQQSDNLIQ